MFSLKSKKTLAARLFVLAAIIFGSFGSLPAQSNSAGNKKVCEEYTNLLQLDAERNKTQKAITEADSRIKTLEEKLSKLDSLATELDETNNSIKTMEENKNRTVDEEQELEELKDDKKDTEGIITGVKGGKTPEQLKEELTKLKDDYSAHLAKMSCLTDQINGWASPDVVYKLYTSFFFAFLIMIVISGFFWTVLTDKVVGRAVFNGEIGLQFIALFSIVLAIVLFGITGILEAKELSALLGSLAGYILGRTMSKGNDTNSGSGSGGSSAGKVSSIRIKPAKTTLDMTKSTVKLTAEILDASGNILTSPSLEWKSSDETVATVDAEGIVSRVKAGTADITAEFPGIASEKCTITCI